MRQVLFLRSTSGLGCGGTSKRTDSFLLEQSITSNCSKHYASTEESRHRARNYAVNVEDVERHNSRYDSGKETYRKGVFPLCRAYRLCFRTSAFPLCRA